MTTDPRTWCVIVTYNGAPWLEGCLSSLLAGSLVPRIVVVDNASSDDTVRIAREFGGIDVIETGANLGFGRANNIGMSHALNHGAQHVLLLNQDTQVAPDMLHCLRDEASLHPRLGILCPLQLTGSTAGVDPIFLKSYLAPQAPDLVSDSVLGRPALGHYKVAAAPAAAWLLPREFLLEVGGFDPLFFMYSEDDDLCLRARHHQWGIAIVPRARFFHHRGFHRRGQKLSGWQRVQKRRARIRSTLVQQAKVPGGSLPKNAWRSIIRNGLSGLSALLTTLDWTEATATLLAVVSVTAELGTIARHRRLCLQRGAHWLIPSHQPVPSTAAA